MLKNPGIFVGRGFSRDKRPQNENGFRAFCIPTLWVGKPLKFPAAAARPPRAAELFCVRAPRVSIEANDIEANTAMARYSVSIWARWRRSE